MAESALVKLRISVCKGADCRAHGADALHASAEALLRELDLGHACELRRGGCYGQCPYGPNVVVRPAPTGGALELLTGDYRIRGTPDETHYAHVTPETLRRIVTEHVVGGRRVTEAVFDLARERRPRATP